MHRGDISVPFPRSDSFVLWGGSISLETLPSTRWCFPDGMAKLDMLRTCAGRQVMLDGAFSQPLSFDGVISVFYLKIFCLGVIIFDSFIWKLVPVLKDLKNQFQNWSGKPAFGVDLFPGFLTTVNNLHFAGSDHLKISGNLRYRVLSWAWNGSSQALPIKMIAAGKIPVIIFCL